MGDDGPYLVWSHEHGAWWGPGGNGYVRRLREAGRYSRSRAIEICARAIPGSAERHGALQEVPVRLADIEEAIEQYHATFPAMRDRQEPWR